MSGVNLALAIASFAVLAMTLVSGWIKHRLWASEPLFCFFVGIAVGPYALGLIELDLVGNPGHLAIAEQFARVTLALSVMSASLSLPRDFLAGNWRALLLLLVPGTMLMWLVSAGIAWIALEMTVLAALLAGAIVTPTDPVLARSIVIGKLAEEKVPSSTRHLITAESGINDGLALPMVLLPLMLMETGGDAIRRSFAYLAWEVIGALTVGWILGHATGRLFRLAHEKGIAESKSLTATTVALSLLALAGVGLLGADGVLAVFVAGIVLNRAMKEEHVESHEHFQDAVDRSFTLPIFILLGIVAPFEDWLAGGWPLFLAATAIVVFRRLPAWLFLQAVGRPYRDMNEARFAGWFGPIGVAAFFYGTVAAKHGAPPMLWALVSLIIFLSVILHGVTGTPLTRRHGKKARQ